MNYFRNNPIVVAALVVAIGAVVAIMLYRYTSPFEQCYRAAVTEGYDPYRSCQGL